MKLLDGKRGLILGVANERSIAWAITKAAVAQGARVGLNYVDDRMARRVVPLADEIEAAFCVPCDVRDDAQLDALFETVDATLGGLDFVVHSLAFADRDDLLGEFVETSRSGWSLAQDISAYSLVAIAKRARSRMNDGGSIVTMSYYGAEKVVPNYNVMGPAKAALEASVRYLAAELGPQGIRVNGISAGPVKTLAAAGIPGFRKMLKATADATPLKRNITPEEVGQASVFLLSTMGSGVTGEIMHVDAGYHILGAPRP